MRTVQCWRLKLISFFLLLLIIKERVTGNTYI
jgi:hypothetical protein